MEGFLRTALCVVAAALAFMSIWIVVPAPRMFLLPIGVGAPEISPLLLAGAIVTLALTVLAPSSGLTTLARLLAVAAAVLCTWPLLQVRATLRELDRAVAPSNSST